MSNYRNVNKIIFRNIAGGTAMKILRTVVSAIVAAAGVWLCVAQDTTLDRLDFYVYSVCSSLLITLAVAFGIFTFIKHSFGRFIGVFWFSFVGFDALTDESPRFLTEVKLHDGT